MRKGVCGKSYYINTYLHSKNLIASKIKANRFFLLEGLMCVKDDFFSRGSFNTRNGQTIRFWDDTWLADLPIAQKYPTFYNMAQRKEVSLHM
jgi:hypothetical protein